MSYHHHLRWSRNMVWWKNLVMIFLLFRLEWTGGGIGKVGAFVFTPSSSLSSSLQKTVYFPKNTHPTSQQSSSWIRQWTLRRQKQRQQQHLFAIPETFLHDMWSLGKDIMEFHTTASSSVIIDTTTTVITTTSSSHSGFSLPFQDMGQNLFDSLDIGGALRNNVQQVPEAATSLVLDSVGRDLLLFLLASVIITPLSTQVLKMSTPILGYLVAGAILGPHGLNVFSNTKADVELGDFGILFLLFSEGLEVSTTRWSKLLNYLPLGLAQISLTAGVLTCALLVGAPTVLERLPFPLGMEDAVAVVGGVGSSLSSLLNIQNPSEALILALAGTLSTSAFVFPVLKDLEWEDEESGQAATSILLLQDLAVAPLLVLMPYVLGQGPTDYAAIGFLTAKATLGFGAVIVIGSFLLRQLFALVVQTQSTETFVALCLLVSVGIGQLAKILGLTDTAGAFAAGVLLANTNYRAQIQADILPFKGILLGIFFMDAGSSFDWDLVVTQWPTVLIGAMSLILLKALTLFSATRVPRWMEPNRLPSVDGVRLAILLSGGGEFAFVVLALAERLDVLPRDLGGVLTAIVLITMAATPILGEAALKLTKDMSETFDSSHTVEHVGRQSNRIPSSSPNGNELEIASDAVVVCGLGEIGHSLFRALSTELQQVSSELSSTDLLPRLVAFDNDPSLLLTQKSNTDDETQFLLTRSRILFGDAANPQVLRASGITDPSVIFITFEDHYRVLSATSRLRSSFQNTPIFARAQTKSEGQSLMAAGATEVIIEADEMPRYAIALWRQLSMSSSSSSLESSSSSLSLSTSSQDLRLAIATAGGCTMEDIDQLVTFFLSIDRDQSGFVSADEIVTFLQNSKLSLISDDERIVVESWVSSNVKAPIPFIDFCRLYFQAPEVIQRVLT